MGIGKSTKEPVAFKCVECASIVMRINTPSSEVRCSYCSRKIHSIRYTEKNRSLINERNNEKQRKNQSEGKCRCGGILIEGLKYCIKCRERMITWRKSHKKHGMCSYCCKVPPAEGKARCSLCMERQRLAKIKSRNKTTLNSRQA